MGPKSGWWYTYPSEKYFCSSAGFYKFPIYGQWWPVRVLRFHQRVTSQCCHWVLNKALQILQKSDNLRDRDAGLFGWLQLLVLVVPPQEGHVALTVYQPLGLTNLPQGFFRRCLGQCLHLGQQRLNHQRRQDMLEGGGLLLFVPLLRGSKKNRYDAVRTRLKVHHVLVLLQYLVQGIFCTKSKLCYHHLATIINRASEVGPDVFLGWFLADAAWAWEIPRTRSTRSLGMPAVTNHQPVT